MIAWLRCFLRGRGHNAVRHPLGGFRCADCGVTGESLEEMGFKRDGYVGPYRRIYNREHGTFERSTDWRD